ncbi:hypothetical protein MH215_19920 [Paenibacillus sp. ACRSA]|uniref:hypothetical protein n=1 Tax=Paenibacillus sp. ACRSA TaxID=2918211 RepID=UPI001EF5CE93|nr:hypothetical protein [Paenibacillus sp. ACRSA]MCG7379270.1 hypothetical protein [Paenibacillus sp. ACRSA]
MENKTNILIKRSVCILYYAKLDLTNEHGAGWIGGNALVFFDNHSDLIYDHNQKYVFYLVLNHPFKQDSMISIFIPEGSDVHLENNIYPNCLVKVIEHPISAESTNTTFANSSLIKHIISAGQLTNDEESMDRSFLIKVGGTPRLIQNEDYYLAKLKEELFSFFFQVDEDGYPDTLIQEDGSYPFYFGSLYIFAKAGTEIEHPISGFWQFS